jgi:UDP-N-acetylglucosamine transferase subunit ALG13
MAASSADLGSLLPGRRIVIIVTTGTMLPFDRLVQAMDRWAEQHPSEQVFAQIGDGVYTPKNMQWARFLIPGEFADLVRDCSLIVAHAGTGSYFLAAETKKAVVMLPRLAVNREHTTDHQVHTARWLSDKSGVYVAMTEAELPAAITKAQEPGSSVASPASAYAPQSFLIEIRRLLVA